MKILIAGGSGFIGQNLSREYVQKGHSVIILSRASGRKSDSIEFVQWNGKEIPDTVTETDVLINLSGAGIVDKPWTEERKAELISSRVESTRACVLYIQKQSVKPKVFVNAGATGYYGAETQEIVDESAGAGNDFLGETGKAWEQATEGAGIRTVNLRTGIVLGKGGGALEKLLPIFRWGLGGWMGNGKQAFPWIHLQDYISAVLWLVDNEPASGPYNLVSPEYTDNKTFSKMLAKVLNRPCFFPVPGFILRLILGTRAVMILKGPKVKPGKLGAEGFQFQYADLYSALKQLTGMRD